MASRSASIVRETREVRVTATVKLEPGEIVIETGIPFFDHMVETLLYYAGFSGSVEAVEIKKVDDHHVIEDVALALGEVLRRAAGQRVRRFGHAVIPMDEVLVMAAVDYSGRPHASVDLPFTRQEVGGMSLEMVPHFYWSLASTLRATIHVLTLRSGNNHHMAEASFKAVGASLGQALAPSQTVFSTKGMLDV